MADTATRQYKIISGKRGQRSKDTGAVVISRPGDVIELTPDEAKLWPGKLRLLETEPDAIVGEQADDTDDSVGLGSPAGIQEQRAAKEAEEERRSAARKATAANKRGSRASRS